MNKDKKISSLKRTNTLLICILVLIAITFAVSLMLPDREKIQRTEVNTNEQYLQKWVVDFCEIALAQNKFILEQDITQAERERWEVVQEIYPCEKWRLS